MPNIEVEDLTVKYGDFTAVKEVSLSVDPGEIVGIFGSNGAGKSSLLRTIGGVVPAASGRVKVSGYDLGDAAKTDEARSLIGYSPDVGGLIRSSTINEHLSLALVVHNQMHLREQALEMVDSYKLLGHLHVQTAGFSHGQSRNLSVLLALLVARQALILDEPFDGVDINHTGTTMQYIRDAKENGLSVIISTHMRERLAEVSDRIIVMYAGKIVGEGAASEFRGRRGEEHYRRILSEAAAVENDEAPILLPEYSDYEEEDEEYENEPVKQKVVVTGAADSISSHPVPALVGSSVAPVPRSEAGAPSDELGLLESILQQSQMSDADSRGV